MVVFVWCGVWLWICGWLFVVFLFCFELLFCEFESLSDVGCDRVSCGKVVLDLVGFLDFIEVVELCDVYYWYDWFRVWSCDYVIVCGQIDGDGDFVEGGVVGGRVSVDIVYSVIFVVWYCLMVISLCEISLCVDVVDI